MRVQSPIAAVDLFCGVGGLSLGLQQAGIDVVAGVDLDPACRFPYEENLQAKFILKSVAELTGADLLEMWPDGHVRLLAGCAPCQPFSSHRRGADTSAEENWGLLWHFGRLVAESLPEFVTMENVTRLGKQVVFGEFVDKLRQLGYAVEFGTLYGPEFGLAQERRRLVMLASRVGPVSMPKEVGIADFASTVHHVIGDLPALESGDSDPNDKLHTARKLSPLNLRRIRASKPGGTWRDWPEEIVSPCHRRDSGASFQAFYGRMRGDKPSPTITTQSYNFGTGRFGHPEQDRSLTLREAAMLQGFPRNYRFFRESERMSMKAVGRLIGNAVPPAFGKAIGQSFVDVASADPHRGRTLDTAVAMGAGVSVT